MAEQSKEAQDILEFLDNIIEAMDESGVDGRAEAARKYILNHSKEVSDPVIAALN